jgi:SAM-dependent methyltransferase
MLEKTLYRLHDINKEFYQRFGEAFAETRRRIQPGVARALEEWVSDGDWLDIGCGSGALSQAWIKQGLRGSYSGIDFSPALLHEANNLLSINPPGKELKISFQQVDLLGVNWQEFVEHSGFNGVLAFAVLHHIPGAAQREKLIKQIAQLLKTGGVFIHSEWQFQHSPKLMARVQSWKTAGLTDEDVEEGDYLLDWRHQTTDQAEGHGLRYVHLFSKPELQHLAETGGFVIQQEYESDGAGERLGLYQVWFKKT